MYIYIEANCPPFLKVNPEKTRPKFPSKKKQGWNNWVLCTYPFYTMIFVTGNHFFFYQPHGLPPFPRAGLIRQTLRSEPGSGQATFLPAQAHHLPAESEVQVGRFETMEWNLVPLIGGRGQNTLPETNSLHLKMDGWNTTFIWGPGLF